MRKGENIFENRIYLLEYLIGILFFCVCIYLFFTNRDIFYGVFIAFVLQAMCIKKIIMSEDFILINYPFIPYIKKHCCPTKEIERVAVTPPFFVSFL